MSSNICMVIIAALMLPHYCDSTSVVAKTGTLDTTADSVSVDLEMAGGTAGTPIKVATVTIEDSPQSSVDFQAQVDPKLGDTAAAIKVHATGLTPFTAYNLQVTGAHDGTNALGTDDLTEAFCTMAGEVKNLAVDSGTDTNEKQIKLTWAAPDGPAPDQYSVSIGDYEQTSTGLSFVIDKLDADGTALEAGTEYKCTVKVQYTTDASPCIVADHGTSVGEEIACSTTGGSSGSGGSSGTGGDKECSAVGLGLSKMAILVVLYGMFLA